MRFSLVGPLQIRHKVLLVLRDHKLDLIADLVADAMLKFDCRADRFNSLGKDFQAVDAGDQDLCLKTMEF